MNTLALILASTGNTALLAMAPTSPLDDDMNQQQVLSSAEARIIGVSLSHLVEETKRNADAVASISESLHVLTSIETSQREVMERLKEGSIRMTDHEKRLQLIEQNMPALLEMRKWVMAGILAGVGMIGTALLKLVILDVPRIPAAQQMQYVPAPQQQQQPMPAQVVPRQ